MTAPAGAHFPDPGTTASEPPRPGRCRAAKRERTGRSNRPRPHRRPRLPRALSAGYSTGSAVSSFRNTVLARRAAHGRRLSRRTGG